MTEKDPQLSTKPVYHEVFNLVFTRLLANIDREKMYVDPRNKVIDHPLLAERFGKDSVIDREILNLLENILWLKGDNGNYYREILDNISIDPEVSKDCLKILRALTSDLPLQSSATLANVLQFPEPEIDGIERQRDLIQEVVRSKFRLPSPAYNFGLYPPVKAERLGARFDDIMQTIEGCRAAVGELTDDPATQQSILDELDYAQHWFTRKYQSLKTITNE